MNEVKSNLAKLLAQEGIEVVHDPKMSTAAFDPKKRILYLPVLKEMTGDVYDLFVMHEVGHALYTPQDGFHSTPEDRGQRYKGFLNVVEDARIEKKVKRKYPGGRGNMIRGYHKLMDQDFFGVKGANVNALSCIDRFNLYFKCGLALDIKFKPEEQEFIERGATLESWDDVLDLVEDLWAYAEDEEATTDLQEMLGWQETEEDGDFEEMDIDLPDGSGEVQDGEESETDEDIDGNHKSDEYDDEDGEEQDEENDGWEGGSFINEDHNISQQSITDRNFRANEKDLVKTDVQGNFHYVNIPDLDPELFICDHKYIIKNMMPNCEEIIENRKQHYGGGYYWGAYVGQYASLEEFNTHNKPIISYMVKEFEMRKSANMAKRAKIAQTGILNTSALYKYKIDDRIFKSILHTPEGKNHGLIFYIDFSGSMNGVISDVISQTLLMAMFCRQVKIPYRVYGYTNGSEHKLGQTLKEMWDKTGEKMSKYSMRRSGQIVKFSEGDQSFDTSCCLYELFTDRQSSSDFQKIARALIEFPSMGVQLIPMGGTPLNEAILNGINLARNFRKTYNLDIVNTIFMSDGDSHSSNRYWKNDIEEAHRRSYGDKMFSELGEYGHYQLGRDTIYYKHKATNAQVVMPNESKNRRYHWGWLQTKKFMELYRLATGSNTIFMNIVNRPDYLTAEKANMNQFKLKEEIRSAGWLRTEDEGVDGIYTILSRAFRIKDDAEKKFDKVSVGDGAKIGAVKSAFRSMNKNRLKQRFLVGNFIEEIA